MTTLSNRRYVIVYCFIARSTPQPAAASKARGRCRPRPFLLSTRGGTGGGSLQHLYTVTATLTDDDAALAVDQNAVGTEELPISTALAADGSHVAAVTVA